MYQRLSFWKAFLKKGDLPKRTHPLVLEIWPCELPFFFNQLTVWPKSGVACAGVSTCAGSMAVTPKICIEGASTSNLVTDPINILAFCPHTYRPKSMSSTPKFKSPELPAFMKSICCRSNQSTTLSLPLPVSKANILTELYALQQRCSTLAFALAQSPLTSPELRNDYAIASQMPADKDLAMFLTLDQVNWSSSSNASQPEGWEEGSLGHIHLEPMYQPTQALLNHAHSTHDTVGPEASMLPQDILPTDHLQLDAPAMENFEWLHDIDIFDFNAASLESLQEGLDVHEEETTSATDTPAGSLSNISPVLPSISKARSRRAAGSSTANRLGRRHHCPSCMQTFHRRSDRDRHALAHDLNAPRFDCSFPGCDRVGRNGFLRRDKLTQHQAYKSH